MFIFIRPSFSITMHEPGFASFDKSPVLAPWYISADTLLLTQNGSSLKWAYVEKVEDQLVELTALLDAQDKLLGLFKPNTYIHAHPLKGKFLVWDRAIKPSDRPSLPIQLFETKSLAP